MVIVARDSERGEAARAEIVRETGNPSVSLLLADLASQAQIRGLAEEFRQRFDRLHVLINNAASFSWRRKVTEDGIELQFAVNHLAPFLLTHLLLDLLRVSAPARIINVSSGAHHHALLDWDDLQGERGYFGWRAYSNSKLGNILFTRELARRLAGSGVTANAMHPGRVGTNIVFANCPPLRLLKPSFLTPEQGARTIVYLACSPEVEGVSGKYFVREQEVEPAAAALDEEAARRLWEVSARLVGVREPIRGA